MSIHLQNIFDASSSNEGIDGYNYRPFVATNELQQKERLEQLRHEPLVGSIMIAVSGFFSLNLVSQRTELPYLLLLDHGTRVIHFWHAVRTIVLESEQHTETSLRIIKLLDDNKEMYFSGSPIIDTQKATRKTQLRLEDEINQGISWLSNQERFQHIKKMFSENRIAIKCIDLSNSRNMEGIAAVLKTHQLVVDILYLSNVYRYVQTERKLPSFYQGIDLITHEKTWVIDAHFKHGGLSNKLLTRAFQRGKESICFCLSPPPAFGNKETEDRKKPALKRTFAMIEIDETAS